MHLSWEGVNVSKSCMPGASQGCSQSSFPANSAGMRTVQSVCSVCRGKHRVCSCLWRHEAAI